MARERVTNLLAVLVFSAVVASVAWWAFPDVKAGWLASASARSAPEER